MLKVYGSEMCPDCRACKMNFDAAGIEYEYIDINANMKNLRDFLIYRDKEPVFDHLKAIHDIGIPACVKSDGEVFTDWEGYMTENGYQIITDNEPSEACSLDRKGC